MTGEENSITKYSHEVSMLACKMGWNAIDHKLFKISMVTSAREDLLEQTVDRVIKINQGKCVFYKAMRGDYKNTYYYVYISNLSEEEIIRILNMKAFW